MKIREVDLCDASQMSVLLQELVELGIRRSPSDREFVREHYIEHPDNIKCSVAEGADGSVLGFQILKIASPGNIYGVEVGWGIVGTHVRANAARRGVGKALFESTRSAAAEAGIQKIDATIGATNNEGLAYYDAMGFKTYRRPEGRVCKYFRIGA